ncbi:MAG: outer rane surface lipoprotein [Geobacteraceae bacterium]|nr:outer rane surface lipoprotein [Geobacteraceae bacterium]
MRLAAWYLPTIVLLFLATSCTTMVPRKNLPYPLTNESFGDQVKTVSIPLPVIASSPNEGITYGALSAFLLHNSKDEVSTLLAPQINNNQNFGITTTLYGAFYPSADRNWEINLSKSTKVNEDYEFKIRDNSFLGKKLELNAFLFRFTDGSARFFGFQSDSSAENETNYGDEETGFIVSAGYKLTDRLQVIVGERFKDVNIRKGAIKGLPFIADRFSQSEVPGIFGFTVNAQKISLVYSTMDSRDMPTQGFYGKISIENSSKLLGSTDGYRHYEAETKGYFPLKEARYISVARLAYNQTLGGNVPFLERSILGGETTLRGYGRNRFIDSSYFLCNLEERIRLFRWSIFNVNSDWEVAPFIDLGAVMETLDKARAKNFEFNPGIGFRAVVRPNIVGRIDIGVGNEGPAVFVGLGYPF